MLVLKLLNYKLVVPPNLKKNNFSPKLYFPLFFDPNLREERESGWILVIKRKSRLTSIPAMKKKIFLC
jgi:hypothetical protein